jgi:hypothetical protein
VLSLSGGAPILTPDVVSPHAAVGDMLELAFAMRVSYPVKVGVHVVRGSFETSGSVLLDGEGLTVGRATSSADLSLSHLSALMRYEPYWRPVRPCVELSAGPEMLWTDYGIIDARGRTVESDSTMHSVGVLSGATLSLDIPFSRDHTRIERPAIMIDLSGTLGVRYWATTPMRHRQVDGSLGVTEARSVMQAWLPFVALNRSFETHPEVVMRHRRP